VIVNDGSLVTPACAGVTSFGCGDAFVLFNVESLESVRLLKRGKSQYSVVLARFFPGQQCVSAGMIRVN
jgi:hypothetical protein